MSRLNKKYIERFIDGDDSCFPYIYEYYQNKIFYLGVSILHNEADSEEVVQNSFIKIIENRNSLTDKKAFNSWVYRIAYNVSLDIYRKNAKYTGGTDFSIDNLVDDKETSIVDDMNKKELITEIQKSIDRLPDDQRQIASLRFIGELSVEDIAGIMNIPVGTVKSRLHRVKKVLKKDLTSKKVTPAAYLSLAINPLTVRLFLDVVKQNALDVDAKTSIAANIEKVTGVSAVGSVATHATLATVLTTAVVTGSLAVGGAAVYVSVNNTDDAKPKTTTEPVKTDPSYKGYQYSSDVTNQDVQVALNFSEEVDASQVTVSLNGEAIQVDKAKGSQLAFVAPDNGDYQITYNGRTYSCKVTNIDKQYPTLLSTRDEDGYLVIDVSDNMSGVDFNSSYYELDGRQIKLNKVSESQAKSGETIDGSGKLYLYDNAGNYAVFNMNRGE